MGTVADFAIQPIQALFSFPFEERSTWAFNSEGILEMTTGVSST